MADSVTAVQIKAYTELVLMRAQQTESRLRGWARTEDNVKGESVSFDRIGMVEMAIKPSQNAPTPNMDPQHSRRWATLAPYFANIYLDRSIKPTLITDPTSDYVKALSAAIGRQWDRFILAAAIGTATTGPIGPGGDATHSGSETWPVTDRKTTSHRIASAGVGLTITKLRQAKNILDALMVGSDRVFVWDSFGQENLLATTEVTSADYNTVKALVKGDVNTFLGFDFQMVDSDLMTVAASVVSGIAMERGAVGLGIGEDKTIRISERADLSYSWQIYGELMGGAVRRDGERVVEVQYLQTTL